jgi:hypothetical protein
MNTLFALVLVSLFVVPTLYHIVSDYRTRRARDFSLIPHKIRHTVGALFRLGLIAAAFTTNIATDLSPAVYGPYLIVALLSVVMIAVTVTDRRLFVDADTGLVTWQKISLPWWRPGARVAYIDKVASIAYNGERYMNLLGLAQLQQHWSVNYNGSVSTSGHYSESTLRRLAEAFNCYCRAFTRHDSGVDRARRRMVREALEEKLAPTRNSTEAQSSRTSQRRRCGAAHSGPRGS